MNDKTKQALELASEELQFFHIAGLARLQTLEAITAIKEALADHVPDTTKMIEQSAKQCWKCGDMDAAFQAKCTVPACGMKEQPSKPSYEELDRIADDLQALCDKQAIRLGKLEAQQPVAYVYEREVDGFGLRKDVKFLKPVEVGADLYAFPKSSKPWVGLTDEEIISMSRYDLEYAALIGEVQRKLKEKNA